MPPWKEELMAPRKVGSGVAMLAKVVMGVILFGGRPGLKHNLILNSKRQSSEISDPKLSQNNSRTFCSFCLKSKPINHSVRQSQRVHLTV